MTYIHKVLYFNIIWNCFLYNLSHFFSDISETTVYVYSLYNIMRKMHTKKIGACNFTVVIMYLLVIYHLFTHNCFNPFYQMPLSSKVKAARQRQRVNADPAAREEYHARRRERYVKNLKNEN